MFFAEINLRKLTAYGIKFSVQSKLLFVFGISIIAMALWMGFFGYYTGINNRIDEIKKSRYEKLSIISQTIFAKKDTINNSVLFDKINNLNIPTSECILLVDKSGEILSDFKLPTNIFITKTDNIDNLIKANFNNTKYIYDNINQNIISFEPVNENYKLVLIKNIQSIDMNTFWIWFIIFLFIGIVVAGLNSVTISVWIGKSTKNINSLFEKLAENDISENATKDSEDEFGEIAEKYNIFIKQIRNLIDMVQKSSISVLSAGTQLSSMSEQISQQASEQASTTEEVATSMEELIVSVKMNTENATSTSGTTQKSATEIEKSNTTFLEIINLISEKIKIVLSITDKIDILSINAAIEAARAGEAGEGFSVVADEIRKLADKTKLASTEIENLIKSGKKKSETAGKRLTKLIPEILQGTDLLKNIILESKEQQSGVENINISVQQLTEITSENAASAEEMSSSAEELSTQAEQLKELISVFKIGVLEPEKT